MHILIVILIILGLLSWVLAAFRVAAPRVDLWILGWFLIGLAVLLPTITA